MKCAVLLTFLFSSVFSKGLREEFTWNRVNYMWPRNSRYHKGENYGDEIVFPDNTDTEESDDKLNINNLGDLYLVENVVPMGTNRWQNKLFVTVPRRRNGVPSTLNYIWINSTQKHNVPLIPYPNWEVNQLPAAGEGGHLVSVYRTAVDVCDRLWMVDSGQIETPGNSTIVQPPSIVIIDLHTDRIIRKYTLKSSDYVPASNLASLVIDVTPITCNEAYAYIPDLWGYGVIVYSFQENESWRVKHNYFYLEPQAGEFMVGGVRFQWNVGVFSLGLSNINADKFRTVYFHAASGTHIYSVSTRILRDRKLATRTFHEDDFKDEIDRGPGSQTAASDLHKPSGILFLGLINQNALGCWNINKGAKLENFDVVYKDDQKFIYPSDIKVYGDEVIVLTNTMPVWLYSQLNYDKINFRVWIANVNEAVKQTACSFNNQPSRKPGYR